MTSSYASFFCMTFLFAFVNFFLIIPRYISIHSDALLLLIIAACFVILCGYLLCLRFLTDRCNFTTHFTFFSFLIRIGSPFFHSVISRLMRFHSFLFKRFLACHLVFDCCVCCSCCLPPTSVSVFLSGFFPS